MRTKMIKHLALKMEQVIFGECSLFLHGFYFPHPFYASQTHRLKQDKELSQEHQEPETESLLAFAQHHGRFRIWPLPPVGEEPSHWRLLMHHEGRAPGSDQVIATMHQVDVCGCHD